MAPKKRMVTKNVILDKNQEHCQRESENRAVKGNPVVSKNTNGESHVTNELTEAAEEISFISQSHHEWKCSKTYKTYKRQLQPITKYFPTFGSNKKLINNESSEPKESPTLHDSSQDSSQGSNGVFPVSTKFPIDLSKTQDNFLLTVYLENPLEKSENSERFRENVSLSVRKRANEECSKQQPSKKAKANDEGNLIEKAQWSSQLSKLSFEVSDDEEEKENLTNGNKKSPTMYFCKHCDYSEVTIAHMHSHYDIDHPYVRYEATYIQDPCDQSATFRCLECPVEFLSVPDLQRHYTENHPDRPDFQNTSSQFHLVHKCFGCSYITEDLGDLKTHYRETHPTYRVDNALKYCRYSLSSSHSYHSDDMKSQCSDSEVLSPERWRKTEIRHSMPECPTSNIRPGNDCRTSPEHSACVTSESTLQIPANKSSESVTCENISHFPKETKKGKVAVSLNPQNPPEASQLHAELKTASEAVKPAGDVSEVEKSPAITSVAGQHNDKHFAQHSSIKSKVMLYNSIQKEKLQSKPETPVTTPDSERSKQVCRNGDERPEMDKASDANVTGLNPYSHPESLFYCHICNYGGQSPLAVVLHQVHSHSKRIASLERVNNHTALIREVMKKSTLEVNNASFSCNLPLPILFKNEKQVFFCHLCNYRQKTLRQVLRHCLLKHRGVTISAEEVERYTSMVLQQRSEALERTTGREGNQSLGKEEVPRTKTGLEEDTAAATKQQRSLQCCRVQEQRPDQKITPKDVNTPLHAGPKSASPKTKKSKEVSLTFHAYQVPLEFDTFPGSLAASVCVSPENVKGSFSAATFPIQDCPDIQCVRKHKGDAMKKDVTHTGVHFYICPHCPYVNIKLQGVLCHCQRRHPLLTPGADRFSLDQIYLNNCEESVENQGHRRERGYICKICSQICATLEKLNRHLVEAHISTAASSELKQSQTAQLPNVNGKNGENLSNSPKSGPKVSLSSDVNRYITSALESQDCFYTCALCTKFYSSRKDLGEHYVEKHGKEAFSKYCTNTPSVVDKGVSKINNSPQSKPDSVLSKQIASEACDCGLMSAENKLVLKYPKCPYVHARNSSALAHCHMRHPILLIRRCKVQTDVINVADVIKCQSLGVNSGITDYACEQGPQDHNSLKTLRIHCDLEHNHTTSTTSEHPEGSHYQPQCSQGFVPETLSSPPANNSEMSPDQRLPQSEPEQQEHLECKVCPNVTFDSAEHLIFHYSTLHFSDRMWDFSVLSQASGKSSGLYRCSLCQKQVCGIQKMHHHLDHHGERREQAAESTDLKVSVVDPPLIKPATVSDSANTVYTLFFFLSGFFLWFDSFCCFN